MYRKVNTDMNFVDRERDVLKFWKENRIFEKSMEQREGAEYYTFYDGPPTANGKPHIGHVLTRAIKDLIPRYHTMKGKYVPRKAGWDTHGLPVELEVEKALGLNGKEQIEEYGIEPFIKKCKESVWKYKGMWEDFSEKVGFWADMEDPYITYDDNFIESIWWALDHIYKDGKLFTGFKVVPYCPRCGTPLSAQEVAQGYKLVKEKSAIVRFKVIGEDAYFLAWTTTPWTLPSNVGLCVNPKEEYSKVKCRDGYTYYMATALLDTVLGRFKEEDAPAYEILSACPGNELRGKEYEPLFSYTGEALSSSGKKAHFVVCDDYVTMSDGTGIVHIAPAFGEDDNRVCRENDMPFVRFVDAAGNMTKETGLEGVFVKKADPKILAQLEERGQLFDAPKIEHDYPHCWRCDTPLIYYARDSWFISMSKERDNLLKNNDTVNWIPPSLGKGRFGDWLSNAQDWGISRDRYWGTPLNIWECDSCGKRESVGGREDLFAKSKDERAMTVELHRPYIDEITYKCDCGGVMKRVPEVIDCWFDSGAMPFAQHHYPFENKEVFEAQFPARFISEAVDQTRGWFYSLMAESTLLFDKSPYENCIVLGHVQDKDGKKMSKSKGNAVDPFIALDTFGADAIRWYFYINSAPWLPNRFHDDAVKEGQRKFMGTLWNTYAFYILYAEIDGFNPMEHSLKKEDLSTLDRWILSRLNTTIKEVDENLSAYKIPETARALDSFVDELSNWYVRRCRERFWAKGMEPDKVVAYMTLYTCLKEISKACAPMIPFMTEEIYQNMVRSVDSSVPESIHLCDFPAYDGSMIDTELESQMDLLLKIVSFGRAARNQGNIKNRQPLSKIYISAKDKLAPADIDIIKEELNIKVVEERQDLSQYTSYEFKPQLKTVGPKYGSFMGQIQKALASLDGNKAYDELQSNGYLEFPEIDSSIRLTEEDLLINISNTPDHSAYGDRDLRVVLYTALTEDLKKEGTFRELVSKIQNMRKSADFEVMDRINIGYQTDSGLSDIIEEFRDDIARETLADNISTEKQADYEKEWKIDGETILLSLSKIR